jgi:uncharacterized protein YdaU (DUF1376 family)
VNYYAFHIGDYAVHTRHLSLLEDLAYRRLLDLYYTRESALPADCVAVARLAGMRDNVAEVEAVLGEFFEFNSTGWIHARCDAEIAKANEAADRARTNGARGGRPPITHTEPTNNPVGSQSVSSGNPEITKSQAPNTQYPIPKPKEKTVTPDGVSGSVWTDFLQIRKAKKAPMTDTALAGIAREAEKAGLTLQRAIEISCERGWQSFKADWVTGDKAVMALVTVPGRIGRDPALQKLDDDARNTKGPTLETLARMAQIRAGVH